MMINFEEITFKNLLSFGAQETKIKFTKGINLISGINGSGKSAILDALSFCLFGKPYRNIKIKELINRKNKKELKVSCVFNVNNQDTYQINRTLNPDTFEIIKNGSESNLLPSKKLNQDELNKILGINYTLFKQVISLAVNYNKPFLSLSSLEKREIIEQIFNITIFGQMLKEAKKRMTDLRIKNETTNTTIKILEENLKTLRKNIKDINKAKENFEKTKEEELKSIEERIANYEEIINNINTYLKKLEKEIENTSIDSVKENITKTKNKLNEIIKEINNKEFKLKNNLENIKNFKTDIVCPRCNTILTDEHKNKEINRLSNENNLITLEINKKQEERTIIEKHLNDLESIKLNYEKCKLNIEITLDKRNTLLKELEHLKENKQKIINRKFDIDIVNLNETLNKKIEEYRQTFKNFKNIKNTISNYEMIFNILSETGIKAYFFKKLIPILNNKINEYLRLFEIPIVLVFDELMNEIITNYENPRNAISYYSYSEGEKKRIDMAILLSFINITKTISNWNCNLLIIDELLDGAIDEHGLDNLVTSLKNMTYENNLCIYIISHRLQQDYNSKFNKCLQIQKDDSFSKINYI